MSTLQVVQRKPRTSEKPETFSLRPDGFYPADEVQQTHTLGGLPESLGFGIPLDTSTRASAESKFCYDFGAVRVHADERAAASASALGSRAHTVGRHIVFGTGQYQPSTVAGQRLIAHELAHVIQQSGARPGGAIPISNPGDFLEKEASGVETHSAMQPSPGATGSMLVQRDLLETVRQKAASEAIDWVLKGLAAASPVPLPTTTLKMIAAASKGFFSEGYDQLVKKGKGSQAIDQAWQLAKDPGRLLSFVGHYLWGLVKGLFSPVTGLIQLVMLPFTLGDALIGWIEKAVANAPAIVAAMKDLVAQATKVKAKAEETFASLKDPAKARDVIIGLIEAAVSAGEAVEAELVKKAEGAGRSAATSIVETFASGKWDVIGETVGEIVGSVAIDVILLIFSAGVGDAIAAVGQWVGRVTKAVRGAEAFAALSAEIIEFGKFVAEIEHAIGTLLSKTVLKPLEPLLKELEPLIGSLRKFLRRVLGLAEEGGEAAAAIGAKEVTKGLETEGTKVSAPTTTTKPPPPPPHVEPPPVKVTKTVETPKPTPTALKTTTTELKPVEPIKEPAHLAERGRTLPPKEPPTQLAEPKPAAGTARLLEKQDLFAQYSKQVKPIPGYKDVFVHGTSDSFHVLRNDGTWVTLDQRRLANWLKSTGYAGEDIRLVSCSTGAAPDAIAKDLSNKLGVKVTAPTDTVWVWPDGSMTIGPTEHLNTGRWETFSPGKPTVVPKITTSSESLETGAERVPETLTPVQGETGKAARGGAPSETEQIVSEEELLQQPGVTKGKPTEIRLAEAKYGQEFDILEGAKYPHNQVPIYDRGGSRRRLDSYDPAKGEIISRKSLVSSNGQVAFVDEFDMIAHFQEFALKYPNGAIIAKTSGTLKSGLANKVLSGKYILEVPVQRYTIPDRILQEAARRGVTIRDITGKVY